MFVWIVAAALNTDTGLERTGIHFAAFAFDNRSRLTETLLLIGHRFLLFKSLIQVISSSNLESRSFENCLRHITRAFTARILFEKRVLLHLKYGQSLHCADVAFSM